MRTLILGVVLVLTAWVVALGGVSLFLPSGTPVAVVALGGVDRAIDSVIAAGGSILRVRGGAVLAISQDRGFVRRLYGHGALLVMVAQPGGCIFAPSSASPRFVADGPASGEA